MWDGKPGRVEELETWLRSYHPEELFDQQGALIPRLQELAPKGDRRMGANQMCIRDSPRR